MNCRGQATTAASSRPSLWTLALCFLRLGATSFGGPAAHVALMHAELVERLRWLTAEEFLELLGVAQLIPGPNSTELAMFIGYRRGGLPGLVIAGGCFILPAFLIVWGMAWAYGRWGALPQVGGILYRVKPVMIAILIQALWGLGPTALKRGSLVLIAAVGGLITFLGVNELVVLFGSGACYLGLQALGRSRRPESRGLWPMIPVPVVAVAGSAGDLVPVSLAGLFGFFLKVGAVLSGSGYVLRAYLRADLVDRWQWLTEAQLLDAAWVDAWTCGLTVLSLVGLFLSRVNSAWMILAGAVLGWAVH